MKKRLLSFALILALLVSCLAAVSVAAADGEKVNLTFLDISPREERKTYFTDIFARYNAEKDANVTIEYEEVPWADAYSKMVILGSSGDLPDLINMYPSWVSEFKMSDWIVPLDGYIEESGIMDTFVTSLGPIMKEQADDNGGLYYMLTAVNDRIPGALNGRPGRLNARARILSATAAKEFVVKKRNDGGEFEESMPPRTSIPNNERCQDYEHHHKAVSDIDGRPSGVGFPGGHLRPGNRQRRGGTVL